MGKIILTRPQELSYKIAKDLSKKNLPSLVQPLFSVIQLDNLQLKEKNLQAILITSSNAVFALTKLAIKKELLILAIGKKTASEVKKLGYNNVFSANNSAISLCNLAENKLTKNEGFVFYLAGEIITLDIAEKLQNLGFLARKIIVYQTREIKEFLPITINEIIGGNIAEIWFYSKNSAKIFYQLTKKHNLLRYLKQIKICCLSQNIADFAQEIGFLNISNKIFN